MPRIFQAFFTTRGFGRAAGLGLCAARDIVEAAGGRVVVESPGGPGGCVAVHLPLQVAA